MFNRNYDWYQEKKALAFAVMRQNPTITIRQLQKEIGVAHRSYVATWIRAYRTHEA